MSTLLKVAVPVPERIVQVSDGEGFAVRGMNPRQVAAIYRRHAGTLEELFTRVMDSVKAKGGVDASEVQPVLLALFAESPELMAEIIAAASGGDPTSDEVATITHPQTGEAESLPAFDAAVLIANSLPFPVQAAALSAIGELTFTRDMPLGKFAALVVGLLRSAAGAMQEAISQAALRTGSGASGGK